MTRAALLAIALIALVATPAEAAKKPKPRLGRTVVVHATDGKVTFKKPHQRGSTKVTKKPVAIPMGSTVDTTHGKVALASAKKAGGTQSGTFSQGAFTVTQQKSDDTTDLTLTGGDFSICKAAHAAGTQLSAAANRRRRLFGSAHGHFRTRGRNSSATIRGTEWLTEDRCNGTVTENKSPNKTSKVVTESRDLHFDLDPGQTITYYCNKLYIDSDTYCTMLLAYPDEGIIARGIITQTDVDHYQFCVVAESGDAGCSGPLPLSGDDDKSFRQGVFACPVRQTGVFEFGWSLDDLQTFLYPTLSLRLNVEGPDTPCQTVPETSGVLPKGLSLH